MLFIPTEKKRWPISTCSHLSGELGLSLAFSPILLFFFSSKSCSDVGAKIVIFELEKKEEGRRKFFGFSEQELEFLRHDLLAKSSLTNSRC